MTDHHECLRVLSLCFCRLDMLCGGSLLMRNRLKAHEYSMSASVGHQKSWLPCRARGPDMERCNFSRCELHSVTGIHLDHSKDDHSKYMHRASCKLRHMRLLRCLMTTTFCTEISRTDDEKCNVIGTFWLRMSGFDDCS